RLNSMKNRMRRFAISILCLSVLGRVAAQTKKVYTIPADSVKITYCDSAELILENHTQNVPGFLFNTGNGRTIFKRGAQKVNDSVYLVGADTVKVPRQVTNYWSLTGNSNIDTAHQHLGTNDAKPLIFYSGGLERMRLFPGGNLGIGTSYHDNSF